MMMPPRISLRQSLLCRVREYRTSRNDKKKSERKREICVLVVVSTRHRRIKDKSSGDGAGRGCKGVKSWSRFTSYHLRMSRWLPLALPTVARQKKTPAPTLSRPAKTRFFLAGVYDPVETQRGCGAIFSSDSITSAIIDAVGREPVGVAMKVSLIRFTDDLKKERSTAWKGFLGHTCGDRTRRRLFGRITRDCDCLIDIHSCEKFHI